MIRVRPILVSGIGRYSFQYQCWYQFAYLNSFAALPHARCIIFHSRKWMSEALVAAYRPWFSQWLGTTHGHCSWWTFDLLTLKSWRTGGSRDQPCHQAWRPYAYLFMSYNVSHWLPLKMRIWPCACTESRDPWILDQKQLHFWNAQPQFAFSLCHFDGSTMKVIKVIWENNSQPCVKRRMSFCACAKSRDLLKVP